MASKIEGKVTSVNVTNDTNYATIHMGKDKYRYAQDGKRSSIIYMTCVISIVHDKSVEIVADDDTQSKGIVTAVRLIK